MAVVVRCTEAFAALMQYAAAAAAVCVCVCAARANMDKAGLTGPILPEAIREAYRQLIQEGKVPHVRPQRRRLR